VRDKRGVADWTHRRGLPAGQPLAEVGQGIYEAESRTAETTTPTTFRPRVVQGDAAAGGRRCFMKLADKGPIKPPPALKGPAQLVSQEIQSWPGIVAATHWLLYDRTQVDGADFYVGERELGHIHLDGEIHLGATRTLAAMLIEHDLADPFEWGDDWVQYRICKKVDVGHAVWLFRLGYDRLNGTGIARLRQRVIDYRVPAGLRRRA
jgi:hypothetical protein